MKCLFLQIFRPCYSNCKFVWQKNPEREPAGGSDNTKQALDELKRDIGWRGKDSVKSGSASEPLPERIDIHGSINPTPENLRRISKDLDQIYRNVLQTRKAGEFNPEILKKYENIIMDLSQAMLYKAITENGSEHELKELFEDKMEILCGRVTATTSLGQMWETVKEISRELFMNSTDSEWNKPYDWELEGENRHLEERAGQIKPKHKAFIVAELVELEKYYLERLKDKCPHEWLVFPGYDGDALEFVMEEELPMYRELFLSRAIVEKDDPSAFTSAYSDFIKKSFRECIANAGHKADMEEEDAEESKERRGNLEWMALRQRILNQTRR